jgi:threo-3-hydroxy-L-aspartate ammonia-lyase
LGAVTAELAITYDDVLAARESLAGRVHRTPVVTSRRLDEIAGRRLFFKCENLQRGGAFKIRGATNRIRSLTPEERRRGVAAFSSGNHAQAVAIAAGELGIDAKIVMPDDAPAPKVAATRAYGATIVTYDRRREDREALGRKLAEEEGRVLVPPYDDPLVMAGQGTAALELIEEVPDLDAVVAPVGGGGLLAGTATAAGGGSRPVAAWGAEPAQADDTARSLEAGERVRIPPPDTIADGGRAEIPGALTFPILQARAAGVVRVPEEAIARAMLLLLTRAKLVVEPTGALPAAAALEGLLPPELQRVGVILSGGNVDPAVLAMILQDSFSRDTPR